MLRKALLLLCLMVYFPALAQAWTITAKIGSPSGSISGGSPARVTVSSGTGYLTVPAGDTTVTITPNSGYSVSLVTLDGVAQSTPAIGGVITVPQAGKTSRTLIAYFTAASYTMTVSQAPGGLVTVQRISPTVGPVSQTGIASLRTGYLVRVTAAPNSGYTVTSIMVDGSSVWSGSSGAAQAYDYTVGSTSPTVTATFVSTPVVSANLSVNAMITSVNGTITLDASGSTTNDAPLSYRFSVASGDQTKVTLTPNTSSTNPVATFQANAPGTYALLVTVTSARGAVSSATSSALSVVTQSAYDSQVCVSCHGGRDPAIVSSFQLSTHYLSAAISCSNCHNPDASLVHPYLVQPTGVCQGCHSTATPGVVAGYLASPHNGVVTCAGCHADHSVKTDFNVCGSCHTTLYDANAIHYNGATLLSGICQSCHAPHLFAPVATVAHFNGYTSYANSGYAAAYVTTRTACADCHKGGDPASADDAALKQFRVEWAASGHGDGSAASWKNSALFNWKAAGTPGGSVAANSATMDCVRCHTARGFVQSVTGGTLDPVGSTPDHSAEPLACNACHNPDFTPRQLPALSAYYNYSAALVGRVIVRHDYPDLKESNICLNCHAGRAAGATITAIAARTAQQAYSSSFWRQASNLDGHGLAAGGALFGVTGYQYPGQSYGNFSIDHSSLAVAGGAGPCVGCHMQGSSHRYLAVAGVVCNGCHGNGNMTDSLLAARQAEFSSALKALQAALTLKGFAPNMGANGLLLYPDFSCTNWGGAATGPGNLGAALNFSLLSRDPGAYAHNPTYIKRLIRDSIDWLVNGSVDRSRDLGAAIDALLPASADQASAKGFLSGSANGSASCNVCHAASLDIKGNSIVATYNASRHGKIANGPSCGNCHAPSAQVAHPTATMLTSMAQVSAKCSGCHPLHSWQSAGICTRCHNGHDPKQVTVPYPHFASFSTAQYVTTNLSCDNCHSATDGAGITTFNVYTASRQWARSGKGNNRSAAFTSFDFKTLGTPAPATPANSAGSDCVRCHTTTGYVNYVSSNFQEIHPVGSSGLVPGGDRTREMVACSACHNPTPFLSYDQYDWDTYTFTPAFSRRDVPLVTAYYNYSGAGAPRILNPVTMPYDAGASNNCIVCHSGRVAGSTLRALISKVGAAGSFWNNTPLIDPHSMGAAGILYGKTGYEFAGPGVSYTASGSFVHWSLGDGDPGSCIACHMHYTEKPHVFSPVSSAAGGRITKITAFDQFCSDCHDATTKPIALNDPATLDARKQAFASSLGALQAVLAAKGIYFNPVLSPYFFTLGDPALQAEGTAYRTWNAFYVPGASPLYKGSDLMGAAFNLRLLKAEGGAYTHNSYYAKRLIYDSIDLADDGRLNSSVAVTLQNLPLSAGFTEGDRARASGYVGVRPL